MNIQSQVIQYALNYLVEPVASTSVLSAADSGDDDLALFDGFVEADRVVTTIHVVDESLQLRLERREAVGEAGIEPAFRAIDCHVTKPAEHVVVDNYHDVNHLLVANVDDVSVVAPGIAYVAPAAGWQQALRRFESMNPITFPALGASGDDYPVRQFKMRTMFDSVSHCGRCTSSPSVPASEVRRRSLLPSR